MTTDHQIITFCEEFLATKKFSDYCKNGLHLYGNSEVKKIALGVTASKNFLTEAAEWGADLCICHHGLIFKNLLEIDDIKKGRIEIAIKHNMGIAGFHLPLDAHSEVGNNAQICKLLEIENIHPVEVGFTGDLKNPLSFEDFKTLVEEKLHTKSAFSGNFGNETVSRICIISGGASQYSLEAARSGADTFIFGELSESSYHDIKERNLNFIAAGHYATETLGVQALGKEIEKNFPEIKTQFFREECPV